MSDHNSAPPAAPAGWAVQSVTDVFSYHAGPVYFREAGPVPGVGIFADERHRNTGDIVHGGALLMLADMSLFDICHRKLGRFKAVTLTLSSEFLSPAPVGAFIEASGEMLGGGRTILMARGLVSSQGKPLMSFSGSLRRFE
jgi:acyl-coenzyme A thioesterase PaaI-like protein